MKKIIIFYILLMSSLYAKTEIDKAFILRGNDISGKFTLHSPDIIENRQINEAQVYNSFGCKGKNLSPKLAWKNAPKGTKSFAVTIYDKNAITGSGWWHWIVYDIPVNVTNLDVGSGDDKKALPRGAMQATNDYGFKGYGGMCPPVNSKHNYVVTVYALNVDELKVPKNATPAMVVLYINEHKIGTATINAFYRRNADIVYKQNNIIPRKNKITYKVNHTSDNLLKKENVEYTLDKGKMPAAPKKTTRPVKKTTRPVKANNSTQKAKPAQTAKPVQASKSTQVVQPTKTVEPAQAPKPAQSTTPTKTSTNVVVPADDIIGPVLPQTNNNNIGNK